MISNVSLSPLRFSSPLILVYSEEEFLKIVKEQGKEILKSKFYDGGSAFCHAIKNGYFEGTRTILDLITDVNDPIGPSLPTPLHFACEEASKIKWTLKGEKLFQEQQKKIQIIRLLFEQGAVITEKSLQIIFSKLGELKSNSHYWHIIYLFVIEKNTDLRGRAEEGDRLDEVLRGYLADDEMMKNCPLEAEQIEQLKAEALKTKGKYFPQDVPAIAQKIERLIHSVQFIERDLHINSPRYASYRDKDHISLPDTVNTSKVRKEKIKTSLKHLKVAWLKCGDKKRLLDCFTNKENVVSYFMKGTSAFVEEVDRDSLRKLSLVKVKREKIKAIISKKKWSPLYQYKAQVKEKKKKFKTDSSASMNKLDQLISNSRGILNELGAIKELARVDRKENKQKEKSQEDRSLEEILDNIITAIGTEPEPTFKCQMKSVWEWS
jgi:hypothetical protein